MRKQCTFAFEIGRGFLLSSDINLGINSSAKSNVVSWRDFRRARQQTPSEFKY